ncbi:MAG: hypothetical protein HY246_25725, partial [Proteobacteria bacterium]|nr:hypothetical protein [Pseudomonadota bacterium]
MSEQAIQASVPSVLLGAGKQSEHVLRLVQWVGLPTGDIVLFDDAYPQNSAGALGNPVRGTLKQGLAWAEENKLPAMVALGSRYGGLRYATFRRLVMAGVAIPSVVHPTSLISPRA